MLRLKLEKKLAEEQQQTLQNEENLNEKNQEIIGEEIINEENQEITNQINKEESQLDQQEKNDS